MLIEFPLSWQFHVLITVFVMLTADCQADYWALNTKPWHESDGDGRGCPHFVNKRRLLVKWNTDIQRYSPSLSMFVIVYNSEHLSWAQFKQNKENTTCKILVKLTLPLHSLQHSHKACFRGNMEPPTLQCNWLTRPKMYIFIFFINPISFHGI